jgi:hypothetical protein
MPPVSAYKQSLSFLALAAVLVAASATTTEAQSRGRRGGSGRVVVVGGGGYYASPFFYDPFFYGDPWFGYQYPRYGYPPPYRYYGYEEASVRLEVTPREAEVYVDGYYAGVVDDFDGTFQRLRVEPGEHEIAIYLDGHRPFRQKVYLTPDRVFKIHQALQPLAAGEQPEPRPEPSAAPPPMQGGHGQGQPPRPPQARQPMPRGPVSRRMPPPPPRQEEPGNQPPRSGEPASDYGRLSIRVQPLDAEVSVDGDPWRGPGGQDRLVIDLAEGSHTIEIRKAGFRTYVTQVEIRRGETSQVNVSLRND